MNESPIEQMMDALKKSVDTSKGDGLIAVTIVGDFISEVAEEINFAVTYNDVTEGALREWRDELEAKERELEIREIIVNINQNEIHREDYKRHKQTE